MSTPSSPRPGLRLAEEASSTQETGRSPSSEVGRGGKRCGGMTRKHRRDRSSCQVNGHTGEQCRALLARVGRLRTPLRAGSLVALRPALPGQVCCADLSRLRTYYQVMGAGSCLPIAGHLQHDANGLSRRPPRGQRLPQALAGGGSRPPKGLLAAWLTLPPPVTPCHSDTEYV